VFGVLLFATPAHAQYVGGSPPQAGPTANGPATHVLGVHFSNPAFTSVHSSSSTEPDFLASTGLDVADLVGIGVIAIGAGTVMVRRRRRSAA